jgi:CRISPR-associated protein Csm2
MSGYRPGGPPKGPIGLKELLEREGIKDYFGDYFSTTKHLRPEYLDQWADKLGVVFGREKLNKHQLRAFFNEVKRIETVYGDNYGEELRNRLLTLKAQAHLRQERRTIPKAFRDFIDANIQKVRDSKSFKAFVQHFEAVLAYCEGRLERN